MAKSKRVSKFACNLAHPDHKSLNALAQCQRITSLWVHKLSRHKITLHQVHREIAALDESVRDKYQQYFDYYFSRGGRCK